MSFDDITAHNDSALVEENLKKIYDRGIALISSKKQINAFDKEDEELLETLAGQAVIVIQMTRVINALKEIGSTWFPTLKDDFLKLIMLKAKELVNADFVAIWLLDQTATLKLDRYSGLESNVVENLKLSLDDSFSGMTLKKQEISIARLDVQPDRSMPASQKSFELLKNIGLNSIISIPLIAENIPLGVLNLHTKERVIVEEWEKGWEKNVLEILAAQASIALLNLKRKVELQIAKEEIADSVSKTIFDNMRQMLRLVTHRMNNSVGNIRADIIEILEEKNKFDRKTIKKLKDIKDSAEEALGIPIELNNFAKKLKSDKTAVYVYEIIHDIVKDKETKKIKIVFDNLKNIPPVKANSGLLKEVFNELIQNATKAMPNGGEIIISAQKIDPKMLEIKVKDTGHGIVKENLGKIFEYGYSYWPDAKGAGDGLPIIKVVIEIDHNGKIDVESEPGEGCTVKLLLPLFINKTKG